MTMLDRYLETEQAREDVRRLLDGRDEFVGPDGLCVITGPEGKWRAVTVIHEDADEVACRAYYRPDGDRYIVTDLGEGVRALRLRTGWIHGRANGHAMQERETLASGGVGWVAGMSGDIELDGVKEDQLPDAVCRVMLASLRVAGVAQS